MKQIGRIFPKNIFLKLKKNAGDACPVCNIIMNRFKTVGGHYFITEKDMCTEFRGHVNIVYPDIKTIKISFVIVMGI